MKMYKSIRYRLSAKLLVVNVQNDIVSVEEQWNQQVAKINKLYKTK